MVFKLFCLYLLSPLFCCNLVASPLKSFTTSLAWPRRAATTFLQTPAIFLIYSSLFSFYTSCCSIRCSKFFNLPCWVLARGNSSLPPTKLRLAHFKLSLLGPLFLSLPGMYQVTFFQRHLCGNGNNFGSDPGSSSFCAPADAHRENREERRNLW